MKFLLVLPAALVMRSFIPEVWIITERSNQARDNGYVFFSYVRREHPDRKIYYIIDKSAEDYRKIEKYRNCIQFDSLTHYFYCCLAKVHISAHVGGCVPNDSPFFRYFRKQIGIKNVFIPHGVSYGISDFCLAKYGNIDLFICSGELEYENVLANYGYAEKQAAYTGFPRLDLWHNVKVDKKLIVLMPTWRAYIAQHPEVHFEDTDYFKAYQSLINNQELIDFLEYNGLKLVFYPHHNMKKYINSFGTGSSRIEITDEQYDIQELLKAAALLITDYSSVHFDFAYMGKPVIYYQFDREEFLDKQYQEGLFDFKRDGFGPVALNEKALLMLIKDSAEVGFATKAIYEQRMRNYYTLYDSNNCDRVYKTIRQRLE